jgi:hypothetical protein
MAEITEETQRLSALRMQFPITRTTLLSTLSTIFPIELLSPPDLLYTILDVPLPIPLSPTDPGPPLTLATHKEVTEDTVATALGYAAQVLHLLAAYLGKSLVYPVTYIGSRSLIRDGISAMVGPRMFPLFSKGVDTYRFEYGVFLLNKDIEMLMVDRNLRALDMRHTLPNLKNLLLTLTDGEITIPEIPRSFNSPISSVSDLESTRSQSPPALEVTPSTPKASGNVELPNENQTPPASGSTTPTANDASKKSRPFLGLAPLAGFLRGRYPSTTRSSRVASESNEIGEQTESMPPASDNDAGDEEDDRRTIRGGVQDDGKESVNTQAEKLDDTSGVLPSTSPPTATV